MKISMKEIITQNLYGPNWLKKCTEFRLAALTQRI